MGCTIDSQIYLQKVRVKTSREKCCSFCDPVMFIRLIRLSFVKEQGFSPN